MKKTTSKPSKATRLLLLTCTTLATCLFSFGNAAAQDWSGTSNSFSIATGTDPSGSNSGNLFIGDSGSFNTLTISNGTTISSSNNFYIGSPGNSTSSNNSIIVTGTGSSWNNTGSLLIGYSGSSNTLIITNAGTSSKDTYIGRQSNSNSLIINGIFGAGSDLYIGYSGTSNNICTVANRGMLIVQGTCFITKDNILNIDNGGTLNANNINLDGNLNLEIGGTIAAGTIIVVDPNGILDLGGSTLTVSCPSILGVSQISDGITFDTGGKVINGTLNIDNNDTNAIRLIEGIVPDQDGNGGTLTLLPINSPYSGGVTGGTVSNVTCHFNQQ